jgi:hypothetical protein
MKKTCFASLALCAAICAAGSPAFGALKITEVASTSGAPAGALSGLDWWELTNTGPAAVMLDGYSWEDNSPSGDTAIFPNGITIAAGESIIIHEQASTPVPVAAQFRTDWGLSASVQILEETQFTGFNTFSGLGSSGDEVNLYDPTNTIIASVSFGASTTGKSFEWDGTGASLGLSVVGENFAYAASNNRVGSPGKAVIPEPSALALAAFGLAALASRFRSAATR